MNQHEKSAMRALLDALNDAERLLSFAGCPTSWMLDAKERAVAFLDAQPQPQEFAFVGNVILDGVTVEGVGNGNIRISPSKTRGDA